MFPRRNIETYLFMGIDNMGKVQKVTDYEGAGRCDVVMLMVRDLTDGTYKTLSIDRNTIVEQDTLDPDGTRLQRARHSLLCHMRMVTEWEISRENVVKGGVKLPWRPEDRRIRDGEYGGHRNHQQSGWRSHGYHRG